MEKTFGSVTWQERALLLAMLSFADLKGADTDTCLFTPKACSVLVGKGGKPDSKLRNSLANLCEYGLLEQSVWHKRRVVWLSFKAVRQMRSAIHGGIFEVLNCG